MSPASRALSICVLLILALASPARLRPAPPGPLPCEAEALSVIGDIRTLLGVLDPPPSAIGGLLAKLDAAETSVGKGNANAAQGQLGALRNQVEALVNSGEIAPEDAQALLAAIDGALAVVTTCSGLPRLSFFNVRSGDATNDLFWVNPASPSYSATRILFRTDAHPTGSTDPAATLLGVFVGPAGTRDSTPHVALTNDITYYYAAFAEDVAGVPSAAKLSRGRPQSTSTDFRWAYTIDRPRSVVALTFTHLPAVSEDALHAMASGANGGGWPTGWAPVRIPAPAPARPTSIPPGGPAVGHVSYVGSRTGRVYAVDLDTGMITWTSPDLGGAVLGSVSGDLFGAPPYLLFVGVQRPGGTGALYALKPSDGTIAWSFDDGGGMGPVVTQPTVDLTSNRVYLTSRARAGADTVWCLDYTATSGTLRWSANPGDVHTSPIRSTGVYVGNTAGEIHAFDPMTGNALWSYNTGDGPIQQFVFPSGTRLFYSTANQVEALEDLGSLAQPLWPAPVPVPASSVPLRFGTEVYVPTRDGRIYQLDEGSGTVEKVVTVGDPAAPAGLGALSIFNVGPLVTAGSADGIVYTLRIPLQ